MAYRHTYGQYKDLIGRPIGLAGNNNQLLPLVNEASEMLWAQGDWIHKFARYKLRISNDCNNNRIITWPHEIETIECLQSCNQPIAVRNVYFEFISNGPGSLDSSNTIGTGNGWGYGGNWAGGRVMGDRDEVVTYEDIKPGSKKVKVYNYLPVDDGSQIIILGYDDNFNWIRTLVNGVYTDGEYVTFSASTPPTTVNFFSSITGIQFVTTPRSGDVTITEVDTLNSNAERFLATYAYNEAIPIYRRSVLTGFGNNNCQCVTALVRLRFIPIIYDTDFLQIGNLAALKNMMLALQRRDNGLPQDAEIFQNKAVQILNNELQQYQGIAPKKIVSFQPRQLISSSSNLM